MNKELYDLEAKAGVEEVVKAEQVVAEKRANKKYINHEAWAKRIKEGKAGRWKDK